MPQCEGQRGVDLAVLVNGFPRLSETFVLQELLELERRGLRLHVVALVRPDEIVQHEAVASLRADVEYLPDFSASAPRLARRAAHAAVFCRRPLGYVDALADAVASPDFSRVVLSRALVLAHRLMRLGSPPLYIHFAHRPATVGRLAARFAGVPYGLSAHAKDIWLTAPRELARKVRDARVVVTCTEEGRSYLADLAKGDTPVLLGYHGVSTDVAPPVRQERAVPRVLTVGRLVEKKGHDTLLRAAALLQVRGIAFTLRIAGEGPEWARLQRLAHELGVAERVTFLGPLSVSEVHAEYRDADVFALACRRLANGDRDGIPNVVLEAMTHALPIVSSRLAGVAEAVIDGDGGLLTDQDDEHGMADRLERLLGSSELRRTLGAKARHRVVDRFDSTANLATVVDALTSAGLIAPAADHARARLQAAAA
jgi:glycosyltransferase involved in cell wall biosynthesis